MSGTDHIKELSKVQELEKQLTIKQLQLKSLLAITQSINNNISEESIFDMYKTFISWDMRMEKMALFVSNGDNWFLATAINVDSKIANSKIIQRLKTFKRLQRLNTEEQESMLSDFSVVIPVFHKNEPLAYALIGGFEDDGDFFNRVQFVQTITNIIIVAFENKRLFKAKLKEERLNQSMALASEVQNLFVPDAYPNKAEYELDGIYKPHYKVGGDYLDYFTLSDNEFLFCIADVSGKGVGAAMLMANFHALLRSSIQRFTNLKHLIAELNAAIFSLTNSEKFITFFIAHVNTEKKTIQYINAGHCRPIYVHENQVRFLDKGTSILGVVEKLHSCECEELTYEPNTIILSYTDGLTELQNTEGDFFDEDHLKIFAYANKIKSAKSYNNQLQKRLDSFRGKKEYQDDIAVLTCLLK